MIANVSRNLGRPEPEIPELVERRIAKDDDRFAEGVVERRGAGEPLKFRPFDHERGREGESPRAAKDRSYRPTADGRKEIEFPALQDELARISSEHEVIDIGHPPFQRRKPQDLAVAFQV